MTDEHLDRYKRFQVKPYVIVDGRTPEQVERDQRLLSEVQKRAFNAAEERSPDARDRRLRKQAVVLREPTQTQEQAMQGRAGLDYLPLEACRCGAVPWWNGWRFVLDCDPAAHHVSETAALDKAIARVNAAQALDTIAMPRLVRSDDDD